MQTIPSVKAATPPMTPPTIAPVSFDEVLCAEDDEESDVGARAPDDHVVSGVEELLDCDLTYSPFLRTYPSLLLQHCIDRSELPQQ